MTAEPRPLALFAYLTLARLGMPAYRLTHFLRCRSGKDDPLRGGERFGFAKIARPAGSLVWIHAASVGETNSVLPLIGELTARGATVLLTTVTLTSAELAAQRLPDGALHQFIPYDNPVFLRRFLDHWSPDLALTVESEVWPAAFDALKQRRIPFVLINGRLSAKSARNWSFIRSAGAYVFGCLDLCLAQSEADGKRLKALGCRRVEVPGNLKFDAEPPSAPAGEQAEISRQIGGRPRWLAALTHPGEDEVVLTAHLTLLEERPDLLLLLAPRHPARADDVAAMVRAKGLGLARRSLGEPILPQTQVYLGDTLGEMGLLYGVSGVAFLGGSFADVGGHNPVEAAALDTVIVSGPKVPNARPVYRSLWEAGASLRLEEPEELAGAISQLLEDRVRRQAMRAAAKEIIDGGRGALQRTLDALGPFLDRIGLGGGGQRA
ncbi:3-deoxy-D-manno-octulosonic acid transferase [Roseibium litorale]|uniref:3-deoxy-D-manno-octulosonic acid transferase n=1 Tax=Roseibium litorale TaxID=2803841 RepID=A0ABR9CQP8_9HYPH|nr:3-deoxy-D-manno-octulosonic acid transferase [Roseibium litorale]MBD8892989.1 3-deoxy-D-manno-octulosonic acid transferase [Roseibium litorale]